MEDLSLYRRATQLASLGTKITGKPVIISGIYSDLKEYHQETKPCPNSLTTIQTPISE